MLVTAAPPESADPTTFDEEGEKKKTKTLETSSGKDTGMRRLVEYFVVVSSVPKNKDDPEQNGGAVPSTPSFTEESIKTTLSYGDDENEDEIFVEEYDFQPTITARYPLEDHAGNPLHESVTFFCHPSGAIQLRVDQSMPKVSHCSVYADCSCIVPGGNSPTTHCGMRFSWCVSNPTL